MPKKLRYFRKFAAAYPSEAPLEVQRVDTKRILLPFHGRPIGEEVGVALGIEAAVNINSFDAL